MSDIYTQSVAEASDTLDTAIKEERSGIADHGLGIMEPLKITDEEGWRWYEINGVRYPSVTTIIGQTVANKKLEDYYKKNSANAIQKRLIETGDFGTNAHHIFEAILLGREPEDVDPAFVPHVQGFKRWVADHAVTADHTETVVYSQTHGFAGTVDCLGCVDGKPAVIDFKTSKRYAITNGWQMGAYRIAALEMGLATEETGLIGLSINRETAEVKPFVYTHLDFVQNAFLHTLEVFKALHFHKLNKLDWFWLHRASVKGVL